MKKNELLEQLKQGEFNLSTSISKDHLADKEVLRWYMKNVFEQARWINFKYNHKGTNETRINRMYDNNDNKLLLDLKDLLIYLEKEDKEFAYKVINGIIEYNNSKNINIIRVLIIELSSYTQDNKKEAFYKHLIPNDILFKLDELEDIEIFNMFKQLAKNQNGLGLTRLHINDSIRKILNKYVDKFNLFEKINLMMRNDIAFSIDINEWFNSYTNILSKYDNKEQVFHLLLVYSTDLTENKILSLWEELYNSNKEYSLLTTLFEYIWYYKHIELDKYNINKYINIKFYNHSANYTLLKHLLVKNMWLTQRDAYSHLTSTLLRVLRYGYVYKILKNDTLSKIMFITIEEKTKIKLINSLIENNTSLLLLCNSLEIDIMLLDKIDYKLPEFYISKLKNIKTINKGEWIEETNKLLTKGYSDKEILYIQQHHWKER